MLTLYDNLISGNGYKARLLLALLGIEYNWIDIDLDKKESRTPEFLALNPAGRIPVLVLDDGAVLPESNAILYYLADGTDWLPSGRLDRAQVLRWQCYEQYEHEPALAVVRAWTLHPEWAPQDPAMRAALLAEKRANGAAVLGIMDAALAGSPFFVGSVPTIADLTLYAYTVVAPEGGFDLAPFPHVTAWLSRIAALPGYVPITHRPGTQLPG